MNELAAPQWVPQRRPPERFRGVAFCYRVYLTSPLEHGRDYYCDLFPVSQRLVALEPRRVICIDRPILWWVESLPQVSTDLESVRWVGCYSFLDTVPLSSPPSLAVLRHGSTSLDHCSRSPASAFWSVLSYHGSTVSLFYLLSSTPVSRHSQLLLGIPLSCGRRYTPNHNLGSNLGWDESQVV